MHAHEVRGWRVLATASMPLDAIVRRQPPPRPRALEMHRPAVLLERVRVRVIYAALPLPCALCIQ